MDAADYVLQKFSRLEVDQLQVFLERAVEALDCFLSDGLETAMNRYNSSESV
jgi:PTH1 family peptidyl-tRNA hydrolase